MTFKAFRERFKKRLIEGRIAFDRFAGRDETEFDDIPLKLNFATQLTIARIFSAPVFMICIFYGYHRTAFTIFLFAAISDAFDGAVARAFNQKTWLGSFLDPLADKLFLISAFISLTFFRNCAYNLPVWLTIIVFSRDLLIMGGCLFFEVTYGNITYNPLRISKITTFFQILCVSGAVIWNAFFSNQIQSFFALFLNVATIITLILTLFSGLLYFRIGLVMLNELSDNRNLKDANAAKTKRR